MVVAPLVGFRIEHALRGTPQECGEWGWAGTCKDLAQCAYQPEAEDESLGSSCRARECEDEHETLTGDVFKKRKWGHFRNWGDTVDTCSPWVMPTNEEEIRQVLEHAKLAKYKVRMAGATHSTGGLVTEPGDEKVIVMSLAGYVSNLPFSTTLMEDGSKRVWVNAGWTLFDLYEKIRPGGFFLPAQTAGSFFSLAGIISNTVHGGSYLHGFINGYVTGLRVMTADGEDRLVEKEEELRNWRNSFGLLGIILNIQFQLVKREKLEMDVVTGELSSWSSQELWRFIKQDAQAMLPEDKVPSEGGTAGGQSWNGEFFVDFLNGDQPRIGVYSQKANESATEGNGAPPHVASAYDGQKRKEVEIEGYGKMTWGEAARRMGSAPQTIPGAEGAFKSRHPSTSNMFSKMTILSLNQYVDHMKQAFNDGFFYTGSPVVVETAYFVRPDQAFQCMDIIREVQLEYAKEGSDFLFAVPGEFRFINVEDRAVLQPVPAGLWFNCQLVIYPDFSKNDQAWKGALMKVEQRWREELGGKPHLGKIFGLSGEPGNVRAFSPKEVCKVYSEEQKAAFEKARGEWDPDGLFASGLAMKLLQSCDDLQ